MKKLLVSILLLIITNTATYLRLSTLQTATLNVGDTLISTLGYFQATLMKTNCSLQVSMFNDTNFTYVVKGSYKPSNISSDCASLQVKQGRLVTDSGAQYLYVGPSFNTSTIFTIDDTGIMRLIGTYIILNRVNQWSFETNITQFYTKQPFFYSSSLLTVTFAQTYGPLTNLRNWTYNAQFGQLDIYLNSDPGQMLSYVYSQFKFNNSQISDFNGRTFPAAIFSNITYLPRCFGPRLYLNFKPPFILYVDPYWPRFAVLEQGGYKILQLFYSKLSNYDNPHKERDIKWFTQFSVCPDQTFQFQGQCLTKCPAPYYHQMRGKRGSCILVCEQFTPKNETTRTCSCMTDYQAPKYNSQMVKACPNNSVQYPYGCVCTTNGTYFDKLYTFSCVKTCPNSTFAHQGLCVKCPANCNKCQYDAFYRSLLQCIQCQTGYAIVKGQCSLSCNTNLGYSMINNTCSKCLDSNCVNCTTDISVCLKCGLLYALNNGTCTYSCPNTTLQVASDYFSTSCMQKNVSCQTYLTSHYKTSPFVKCDVCPNNQIAHLGYCVTTCPTGYSSFMGQYCVCNNGLLTINDQCLNLTGCPIKMSFDIISHSCLSCPFGCMSCIGSVCTSCNPGYFLYISPQGIRCRRKSPLFDCSGQYAQVRGVCLVTAFSTLNMTMCTTTVPNCMVCPIYNNQACILCSSGYYLYNNTCILTCPTNFTPYQTTCILLQIQKCEVPHLQSLTQSSIINITKITNSNPYQYYIYNGLQPGNDPVGYIPYFQSITSSTRKTDGLYRDNTFFDAYWTCLKCIPGQGLSNDFKNCYPCPPPCVTCYMAQNYSCLTVGQTNSGCLGYIDYTTKKCVRYCNDTNMYPQMDQGILYCKSSGSVSDYARIDSAIYAQPDGTKIVYFVFQNQLKTDTNISVDIQKTSTSSLKNKVGEASTSNKSSAVSTTSIVPLKDNSYFQVSGNSQDVYIANLTNSITKLQSTEGYYPPNLVYGAVTSLTHPQFMKTWLSIIGQIMGVVIIVMHCVYIGNQLLYKMDNLIILVQSIYYFSFVKILVGKLLAQFYYGWIFSLAGFFPSFFTIPNGYREDAAPISYKLATLDANFIRNAGFTISVSLVYFVGLALVSGLIYLLYKYGKKGQVWHPKIAVSALLAGIQFFSMNLMYWAVACLMYHKGGDVYDKQFYSANTAWSIIFIVFISIYTIARFFFNTIGGVYMVKRIIIAVILAAAFDDQIYLLPLLLLEGVFTITRYVIQTPQTKKQKIYIVVQFLLLLLCYLLLFLCLNAGVNTIIISIVVFLFIVFLASDYVDLYLERLNQWQQVIRQKQLSEQGMQRANSGQIVTQQNN